MVCHAVQSTHLQIFLYQYVNGCIIADAVHLNKLDTARFVSNLLFHQLLGEFRTQRGDLYSFACERLN